MITRKQTYKETTCHTMYTLFLLVIDPFCSSYIHIPRIWLGSLVQWLSRLTNMLMTCKLTFMVQPPQNLLSLNVFQRLQVSLRMGGDLAQSLGGERKQNFWDQIPEWPFLGKDFDFMSKNFWWPFFLVIDSNLSVSVVLKLKYNNGWPILHEKLHFLVTSYYFDSYPIIVLREILGDSWAVPNLEFFWGPAQSL